MKVIRWNKQVIFVYECSKCDIGFGSEAERNEHERYCMARKVVVKI